MHKTIIYQFCLMCKTKLINYFAYYPIFLYFLLCALSYIFIFFTLRIVVFSPIV